ncbi:ribonuclease H-like domain-containing protein [Tanacetum coccineum]
MDLETAQTNTTEKLPLLKQENGNSFKPAAQTTTNVDGSSNTLIPGPVTADEKTQKKNDVKARSMLLMALPNEYLQTFNQYKDANTLFATIQTRFGGNDATKKTQKTLLKKITINGSDTAGYDKSKVKCFNCHKLRHFVMECRGPRNQDNKSRNQDSSRRTINVEENSSKAMLAIDGAGFDWSFMGNEEVPTDMALMDFLNSKEFQQPKFKGYGPKTSKSVSEDTSNEVKESPNASLVKELVSNDKLDKKTIFPTVPKINFVRPQQQEKQVRKPVKYAEMYRSQTPRGYQRNWNNQKSQQLGNDFVMYNKVCFVCGSFDHMQANCNYHERERMVSQNNYTKVKYNYSAKKAHPSA